jgi:hypothetical protein
MNNDEHLEKHLELCRRIYLRMLADGSWPWKGDTDSQKSEDLVESDDNNDDI